MVWRSGTERVGGREGGRRGGGWQETAGFDVYWAESAKHIPDKGDLRDYWMGISSAVDFLSTAPSYTAIGDPILRGMDVGLVNVPYLVAMYLRLFAAGRKSGAHISGGQFVASVELDDTWAWVAMGPERQSDVAAGAPADSEDAPIIDEGSQADLAPVQAPQQLPLPPPAPARTIPQRLGRLEEDVRDCVGMLGAYVDLWRDQ
ncbi:hypothetical protein Tco_0907410 [Tanacetum coccineum]|uniref:Uncharacterized protein n=1 Tax=Tanacetum coccineum TaxID=301880 RepID=A0ABQ5CJA1_9ASTR